MGKTAVIALVAAAALCPLSAAADIYQYVDADGVVHFSSSKTAGSKLYLKSTMPQAAAPGTPRPGVVPFAPQDRDPTRYTRFDEYIRQASGLYQIPEQLVRAVIKVESDYDPRAVSYAGARGLMQLMPDTASGLGVKDINDPRENIFGGVRYLRVLANLFNGDLDLTVAAYNAGEGAVMQHGGIPPYAQTREYVVKVTHYYRRYRTIPDPIEASLWSNPASSAVALPAPTVAPSPAAPPVSQGAPVVVNAR
jgi:soluble lytic murein transglycosylase-like protein